jgi:raffinose/stachyose/melibiose transport system permease protein
MSAPKAIAPHALLALASAFALAPLVGVGLASLNAPGTYVTGFGWPSSPQLTSFTSAWLAGGFSSYMLSSAIVATSVVAISSIGAVLGGYAFGTMRFAGSNLLFFIFLIGLMVPTETMVVPLFYDLLGRGVVGSYTSVIWPKAALELSFGVYWMRTFFRGVPRSVLDAARIDGASSFFTLRKVLLPAAKPAILTMIVLFFMFTWNDFLLPLIMLAGSAGHRTAPLGLANFQGRYSSDVPDLAAAAILVALPVVVVYIVLQRQILRGLFAGAAKG